MKSPGSDTSRDVWHLIAVYTFLDSQRGECRYYCVCKLASEREIIWSFFKMCSSYIFSKQKIKFRIFNRFINTSEFRKKKPNLNCLLGAGGQQANKFCCEHCLCL